jgi:hypothetical protein
MHLYSLEWHETRQRLRRKGVVEHDRDGVEPSRSYLDTALNDNDRLIAECRHLRALVDAVKALAWGDHPEAGADPAAIREYLRDLLVTEPDGAVSAIVPPTPPPRPAPAEVIAAFPNRTYYRPASIRRAGMAWRAGCWFCPGVEAILDPLAIRDGRVTAAGPCPGCRGVYFAEGLVVPELATHAADRRR